jgi:nicotinate phosphoribosyltransferase
VKHDRGLEIYGGSLALLTDLYQLTMAYGYWRTGMANREACFALSFRRHPFKGGYTVACGIGTLAAYLERFRFDTSDLDYLATINGHDGEPIFDDGFLKFLAESTLSCNIEAVAEGTIMFPHEPLLRVRGPIWQAQVLETAILDIVNFQSLIATKAARVCEATNGEPVLEFGLRRAHGIDGALAASRAAYVGGCAGTSNVLAGKLYDIPVKGTHAHSWVMSFDTEIESFRAYAKALPNNCVFLVDTYDSLAGVKNAIEVGRWLRSEGQKLLGIRLDSGDLAYISIEARRMLDEAGFGEAVIFASNDLDEWIIESLKKQGAAVAAWGVGTKLVTGQEDGALGGVYKLTALRDESGQWQPRIKLSEQAVKISTPGVLQVRRFRDQDGLVADGVFDESSPPKGAFTIVDPVDHTRRRKLVPTLDSQDLLTPFLVDGKLVEGRDDSLHAGRERVARELDILHPSIRRLTYPHVYPVGLESGLHEQREQLIFDARRQAGAEPD